jgi:predicted negative regulator of RcsB-dependent stress response
MLTWIIQISIISIIFIFLVHHLIGFFKSTLTVPKIKDLVNSPSQKYQNIFDTINTNSYTNSLANANSLANSNTNSYTAIDLLPTSSVTGLDTSTKDMMKDELKSFLKKQLNINSSSNNNNNDFLANDFSSNNSLQSAF